PTNVWLEITRPRTGAKRLRSVQVGAAAPGRMEGTMARKSKERQQPEKSEGEPCFSCHKSPTTVPTRSRMPSITPDAALILDDCANPRGCNFRERQGFLLLYGYWTAPIGLRCRTGCHSRGGMNMPKLERITKPGPKCLLSVDGGGIRGVLSLSCGGPKPS